MDEYYEIAGVAADIFVYTPDEFKAMKILLIIKKALREDVVIYKKKSQGGSHEVVKAGGRNLEDVKFCV
ncbi:hypothetical protein A3L04_10655 [Thermococcus chitonophagus]|uniref:Uncharacterized protein n=1 Tax=Thermococcus chitonophagus TaxID=54262 RepID=A0A160VSQ1_9EURY|nr:hypothetical protein [Thermococcus chitonophagus]ASJ17494.1 hypothetical protein A3L04_10655 [Thermococcus chitonophagus]CUX78143.1 hypothetical protein CHITON_1364 [Thermococcus chitonophagus]